jgi:hypothetical protein
MGPVARVDAFGREAEMEVGAGAKAGGFEGRTDDLGGGPGYVVLSRTTS